MKERRGADLPQSDSRADRRIGELRREQRDRTEDRWRRRAAALERVAQMQSEGLIQEPRTPPPLFTSMS